MPHYRIDAESAAEFAEINGEQPSEGAEFATYEPAEATLQWDAVADWCRKLRNALLKAGFNAVSCTYDGGYDEGFAHFDAAFGPDGGSDAAALIEQLDGLLTLGVPNPWGDNTWEKASDERKSRDMLDVFADVLCSTLLGSGFGTGDAAIRGRLRCELETGRIVDIEDNPPPSDYW